MSGSTTVRQQVIDAAEAALRGIAPNVLPTGVNVYRSPAGNISEFISGLELPDGPFQAIILRPSDDTDVDESGDSIGRDLELSLIVVTQGADSSTVPLDVTLESLLLYANTTLLVDPAFTAMVSMIHTGKIEWDFETGVDSTAAACMKMQAQYRHARNDMTTLA